MNEKELNKMPPLTRSAVSGLTDGQRRIFNHEYGQKRYRTPEAYALWLVFGLHYAYLNRWGMQVLFWITAGGFLVWWLVDLFCLPSIVRRKNADVANGIVSTIRATQAN